MDKKTIIIAVVAVAVIMLFIIMRDKSSAETVADTMEDKISSDSKKATAAGTSVVMSAEDNAYNQAREKYRTLQGNYPPASWTTEMINVWVSEWGEMSKTLAEYVSLMNKMDKKKTGDSSAKTCSSLADARILLSGAQQEYKVYTEKKAAYEQLRTACAAVSLSPNRYVTDFASSSLTQIKNAVTTVTALKPVYQKYQEYKTVLQNTGLQNTISDWTKESVASIQNAINSLDKMYEQTLNNIAAKCVDAVKKDIMGGIYSSGTEYTNFINCPGSDKYAFNVQVYSDAVAFCAKGSKYKAAFKTALAAAGIKVPNIRCCAWNNRVSCSASLAPYFGITKINAHATGRRNVSAVRALNKYPIVNG